MSAETKVMEIVADVFGKNVSELSVSTRFVDDLHAKSVKIIELIALLEDEFGIEIPFVEARKNKTVGDAVTYVQMRREKKGVAGK